MSDSPEELDSAEELNDDTQLTIRIPNPKVYMARQSQWKGRRGKPRCDHCRMNNLKCDRVLPTCNHCSWINGRECKYTPLPTPAHRGIPRCDRCRLRNLKCDRNLPVCNHCAEDSKTECNYTPKKRHKVPSDHTTVRDKQTPPYGAKTASFLVSEIPSSEEPGSVPRNSQGDSSDGHSFYGQNVASSSHRRPRGSLSDVSRRDDKSPHNQFKTPEPSGRQTASSSSVPPRQTLTTNKLSFISHSFSDQGTISSKPLVESWGHPLFAPLPDVIIQRISNVNPVEMPNRAQFEENFARFLDGLPPELLETAALTPEVYADVCRFLSGDEADHLSDRLKMWVSFHHVRLGSEKYHLLLIPRDAFFQLAASEEEKLRRDYINHIDNHPNTSSTISPKADVIDHELGGFDWTRAFERIPVRNQIYDILVYAHRTHSSSTSMVSETRRIGMAAITWPMVEIFTQLCPLCSLRNKSNSSHSIKSEHPHGACDESTRH
ncbi:hypothetical protein L210DRAFT_3628889 [Boletus edulis BED1]|uniref:Zn(2)-C6 fungal-type domain-containing protein n=1 Tax=Boletus edulis BED1 TaxID=1328754 RepID=A0AAD4GHM2_BOLED|nr:hypothetical protein L210DRAFT_3628889 [Boletus edulis BED1]